MKFYYVVVTNVAQKKITGTLKADSAKTVHAQLNKMGLAVLTLSQQKPANWDSDPYYLEFEFEAQDKSNSFLQGTIKAPNPIVALDQLTEDLQLKVRAIYLVNAKEEQKQIARKNSIAEIRQIKENCEKAQAEREKRTLSGGLSALVKMASCNSAKSELEKEKSTFSPPPVTSPKLAFPKSKGSIQPFSLENYFKNKFDKFYFLLTEIIVPSSNKTRQQACNELSDLFFKPKELKKEEQKQENSTWDSLRIQFWLGMEQLTFFLALIFGLYFLAAQIALATAPNFFSGLALKTVGENALVLFLFLTAGSLRILLFMREKFTSWSSFRTLLLFIFGALGILILGLNLL